MKLVGFDPSSDVPCRLSDSLFPRRKNWDRQMEPVYDRVDLFSRPLARSFIG